MKTNKGLWKVFQSIMTERFNNEAIWLYPPVVLDTITEDYDNLEIYAVKGLMGNTNVGEIYLPDFITDEDDINTLGAVLLDL